MSMIFILILIPVLCITISLFIMSLLNYLTINELDVFLMSTTMFLILVLGFLTMRLIIKNSKNSSVILLNIDKNFLSIFGFFSFNIVALIGLSIMVNYLIYRENIFNFVIGLIILIFYIWIFISYIIKNKKAIFTITMIDNINKHIDLIYLNDEKNEYEIYVRHDKKYIEDEKYLCKCNSMSKEIRKIIKKVGNNNE